MPLGYPVAKCKRPAGCTGDKCKLYLAQNQQAGVKVGLSLISQPEVVGKERQRDRAFPGTVKKVHRCGT